MENGVSDENIFDASLLKTLPWEERRASYRGDIDLLRPGPGLVLRPLSIHDYERGFTSVLAQLTKVGEVSQKQFEDRFRQMKQCPNTYYITVIEDTQKGQVIGSASLVVEQKFIHEIATRGRIEDVVVREEYRGQQLGKLLVDALALLSRKLGCYKLSLECKDENVRFYETMGFQRDEQNFMIQRFKD